MRLTEFIITLKYFAVSDWLYRLILHYQLLAQTIFGGCVQYTIVPIYNPIRLPGNAAV